MARPPYPSDLYDCRAEVFDPARPLSAFQEGLLRSACPAGSRIVEAAPVRTEWLPCPIRVRVELPTGEPRPLLLWLDCHRGGVEREAAVLPALAQSGLPVPAILAGPVVEPARPSLGPMTVFDVLPGKDLGTLTWAGDLPVERANELVLAAVSRLHGLTGRLGRSPVPKALPRRTLVEELEAALAKAGPWRGHPRFVEAARLLRPAVASIETPLAFSNGDYNPGNVLSDGRHVTGFVDFAGACWEDPHAGFAQYWIYDWSPFNHAGIVERYLAAAHLSKRAFAPRLGVRCLRTLRREVPVTRGSARYREHVLGLLDQALADL